MRCWEVTSRYLEVVQSYLPACLVDHGVGRKAYFSIHLLAGPVCLDRYGCICLNLISLPFLDLWVVEEYSGIPAGYLSRPSRFAALSRLAVAPLPAIGRQLASSWRCRCRSRCVRSMTTAD